MLMLYRVFLLTLSKYKLILIERTPLKELSTYYSFLDFLKKKLFI